MSSVKYLKKSRFKILEALYLLSPSSIDRNFFMNLNSSLRMFRGDTFFTMEIRGFKVEVGVVG